MAKAKDKDYNPQASWMALYEFVNIIKRMEIEQRGIGEAWRVQYTTEVLLRNAMNEIRYDAHCKKVNLSVKYPWLKKNTKS